MRSTSIQIRCGTWMLQSKCPFRTERRLAGKRLLLGCWLTVDGLSSEYALCGSSGPTGVFDRQADVLRWPKMQRESKRNNTQSPRRDLIWEVMRIPIFQVLTGRATRSTPPLTPALIVSRGPTAQERHLCRVQHHRGAPARNHDIITATTPAQNRGTRKELSSLYKVPHDFFTSLWNHKLFSHVQSIAQERPTAEANLHNSLSHTQTQPPLLLDHNGIQTLPPPSPCAAILTRCRLARLAKELRRFLHSPDQGVVRRYAPFSLPPLKMIHRDIPPS